MASHIAKPEPPPRTLPSAGYVRLTQFVPVFIPVSFSTWWRWVKCGKAPKPVKLSERITAWRVEDIRAFIDAGGTAAAT